MNLKLVYASLVITLKEFARSRASMFFVLLFPIILMLLFGLIFQDQGEVQYNLLVQDLDGGEHADDLVQIINNTELFTVTDVDPSEDPAQYLLDHKSNAMLIIPEGYSDEFDSILASRFMGIPTNDTVNVTMVYDPANTAAMTKIGILGSIIDGVNKGASGMPDVLMLEMETTVSDDFDYIDFFAPGIIAMSVMTTALFGTVTMNTELRQKGILRKLATTPLSRSEWLLANILYQLCMALLSTISIIAIGMILFGLNPHINLFLPLFVLLNVFAFSGIGMLITRFVKEAESAHAAANAIMFPMMFLSGTFFPLETMPDFLQTFARFLPLFYVNEGLRAAMITLDEGTLITSTIVLVVLAIVIFILGVLLTSWKHD